MKHLFIAVAKFIAMRAIEFLADMACVSARVSNTTFNTAIGRINL